MCATREGLELSHPGIAQRQSHGKLLSSEVIETFAERLNVLAVHYEGRGGREEGKALLQQWKRVVLCSYDQTICALKVLAV